jgi:hypothetical protein
MKNKLFLFALALSAVQIAGAIPVCTSVGAGTMQDYINLGTSGCQLGNQIFYEFGYSYANGAAPAVTASDVQVTALNNSLNPVFVFNANWTVSNGQQANMDITYKVFIVDAGGGILGPPVETFTGATVAVAGTVDNNDLNQVGATISVAETITEVPSGSAPNFGPYLFSFGGTTAYTIPGCNYNVDFNCNSVGLSGRQILVKKDIFLNSGGDGAGNSANVATLTEIQQGLSASAVPEPLTLVLYGGGLIAFGVIGRMRSRQRKPVLRQTDQAGPVDVNTGVAQ